MTGIGKRFNDPSIPRITTDQITPESVIPVEGSTVGKTANLRVNSLAFATHVHQDLLDRLLAIEAKPPTMPLTLGINCGKQQSNESPLIDSLGHYFINDCYYSGGNGGNNGVGNTSGTDIPLLYENERFGGCTYTIPVPEGQYTVRLFFAENYFEQVGERVFDVDIQGSRVLEDFDIIVAAGGGRRAIIRSFPGIQAINKQLTIVVADPGTIMGIQWMKEIT